MTDPNVCTKPPEGWYCTRPAGHEGPCAAEQSAAPVLPELELRTCTFVVHGMVPVDEAFVPLSVEAMREFIDTHPQGARTGCFVASNGVVVEYMAPSPHVAHELAPPDGRGPLIIGSGLGRRDVVWDGKQ